MHRRHIETSIVHYYFCSIDTIIFLLLKKMKLLCTALLIKILQEKALFMEFLSKGAKEAGTALHYCAEQKIQLKHYCKGKRLCNVINITYNYTFY